MVPKQYAWGKGMLIQEYIQNSNIFGNFGRFACTGAFAIVRFWICMSYRRWHSVQGASKKKFGSAGCREKNSFGKIRTTPPRCLMVDP